MHYVKLDISIWMSDRDGIQTMTSHYNLLYLALCLGSLPKKLSLLSMFHQYMMNSFWSHGSSTLKLLRFMVSCKLTLFRFLKVEERIYFRHSKKPTGSGLRCVECRIEPTCPYSAKNIIHSNLPGVG